MSESKVKPERVVLRGYFSEKAGMYFHEGGPEFICSAIVNARDYDRAETERNEVIDRLKAVGAERDALRAEVSRLTAELERASKRYAVLRKSVLQAPMAAGFVNMTTESDIDAQCDQIAGLSVKEGA